jgi:uncharacterized protein YbbK (DUF523 family)
MNQNFGIGEGYDRNPHERGITVKLVSACLAGCLCRYDQQPVACDPIRTLIEKGRALPICPEQMGGLPTPRPPAEIVEGTGEDVLDGRARVVDCHGRDVTDAFLAGARETLKLAQLVGATEAILKERCPSCSSGAIYDGSFSGAQRPGQGVTAALLRRHGVRVESDESWR